MVAARCAADQAEALAFVVRHLPRGQQTPYRLVLDDCAHDLPGAQPFLVQGGACVCVDGSSWLEVCCALVRSAQEGHCRGTVGPGDGAHDGQRPPELLVITSWQHQRPGPQ